MTKNQPEGFLALPKSGKGRGVLVLHAWWGLNETIRSFCTRLAEHGFVAFAPDLYHGQVVDTIPEAEKMVHQVNQNEQTANADIAAALEFLAGKSSPDGSPLGVVAFSMGVWFALGLTISRPELVQAAVVFYGTRPDDYSASQSSYLGHFAENDPYEPEESVQEFEQSLRQAGRPASFQRYPGTGHWFFEPDRPDAYNPAAADLAWQRTLAFLQEKLPV